MKVHLSSTKIEIEVTWCRVFWFVIHPGHFFSLTSAEFEEAKKKYPKLSDAVDSKYVGYALTAGINVDEYAYFDNKTLQEQFERMFQTIPFIAVSKEYEVEIILHNARTHSAKEYLLNDFGKGNWDSMSGEFN